MAGQIPESGTDKCKAPGYPSGTSDGEAIGTFEGEPLYHSSLAPAEYRQLLHENGFRVVMMVFEDPECGGRTVWLAQSTV